MNLLVNSANRSLTIEADSVVNQDLSSDAAVSFGSLSLTTDLAVGDGGTGTSNWNALVSNEEVINLDNDGYGYIIESYAQCTTVGVSPVGMGMWIGIQDTESYVSSSDYAQAQYLAYSTTTPKSLVVNNRAAASWGTPEVIVSSPLNINKYMMVRHLVTYTTPYRNTYIAWDGEF